jgi:hypothetical protein
MDDFVKIIALLCTWYNRRESLVESTAMIPEDWRIVSFDRGEYDSFSATAVNNIVADTYFIVEYDGINKVSKMAQYRLVSVDRVRDADLILDTRRGETRG